MTFSLRVVTLAEYAAWVDATRNAASNVSCPVTGSSVSVTAKDIAWNTNCIGVKADSPITLTVVNDDAGIDHNFAIYDSPKRTKRLIPDLGAFPGVATNTYQLDALPPGKYYFQCDVHGPAMSGAFIVGP